MFQRQKAEDAIINFAPDRTEFDITDPEGHNCTPVEDVDPETASRSGKTPSSNPIRDWTDDDEDECAFLEVFDFYPSLLFLLLFAHQLIWPLRLQRRFRSKLFRVSPPRRSKRRRRFQQGLEVLLQCLMFPLDAALPPSNLG